MARLCNRILGLERVFGGIFLKQTPNAYSLQRLLDDYSREVYSNCHLSTDKHRNYLKLATPRLNNTNLRGELAGLAEHAVSPPHGAPSRIRNTSIFYENDRFSPNLPRGATEEPSFRGPQAKKLHPCDPVLEEHRGPFAASGLAPR